MKGCHVMLNEELLEFLQEALYDLVPYANEQDYTDPEPAYTDELCDSNPEQVLKNLEAKGWTRTDDKFGKKAIKSMQYPASTPPLETDEFRVSVVLQKGVLKLDIRPWGVY
jgi:hypothetical protein